MNPCPRFSALLSTLSLAAVAGAAQAESPLAEIPFRLEAGLPTTAGKVDGVPLKLFWDLGGFASVALTRQALAKTPVTFSADKTTWRDYTGTTYESRNFVASKVVAANASLGELAGTELFLPPDSAAAAFDGYIGFGVLQKYLVVFDYAAGQLTLYNSGDAAAMTKACGTQRFGVRIANGVVESVVDTDAGQLLFQWDTGSSETILRPSALGLTPAAASPAMKSFSKFQLEAKDLGRTVLSLREFRAPNVDGVLGSDFLQSRVFCLDIANRVGALR